MPHYATDGHASVTSFAGRRNMHGSGDPSVGEPDEYTEYVR